MALLNANPHCGRYDALRVPWKIMLSLRELRESESGSSEPA